MIRRPAPSRPETLQRISRRGLISSAVLAGVLSVTGVQVQARPRGGVLRLGLSGVATGWDPRLNPGNVMHVAGQGGVYDTLTRIGAGGELAGELAVDWQPSEGGAVWTLDLRQGVAFHDGSAFTAADVVASLSGVLPVAALSPHRVVFRLAAPDANFPLRLADPLLTIAREGRFDGVGTGLYHLAEFQPDARIRLVRVEDHYRGAEAGLFDAVVIRVIPEARERSAALLAGHVDAVDLPADPHSISDRRGFRVLRAAQGLSFDAEGLRLARAAGLPVIDGPAPDPVAGLADAAHGLPSLNCARYGVGIDALLPVQPTKGMAAGHLPFTLAHSDRLRHGADLGELFDMDSGRIAERWWFA